MTIKNNTKTKTKTKKKKTKNTILVVVESPTKAKTLKKYLSSNYKILASMGHIIDLPKSRMAVDVENNFRPDYITVRGRAKILNALKKEAKKAKTVLLASDPDREGEAISYHLKNKLEEVNSNVMRIEFNEITKEAVRQAIQEPRAIKMNLFFAQQARRILDRLVGYNISPILWKKVKKGLSAGRVQSVALREVCEREQLIQKFVPEEFWNVEALFDSDNKKITALLSKIDGNRAEIKNEKQVLEILDELKRGDYHVSDVKKMEKKRNPLPPYITSKLQQDASTRLGFNAYKTMLIAQQLYEGVELEQEGAAGLITYMRTDSFRVSSGALKRVREYIKENYEPAYLPGEALTYKSKKRAQDAHEAIRPTNPFRTPASIKKSLTRDQYRLYELIWAKFVSSQMTPETSEQTTILIDNGRFQFRAGGKKILFKGFTAVMSEIVTNEEGKEQKEKEKKIPSFENGEKLKALEITPSQHFTSPPPRYNDASIVKKLEESGVGRPSTYAPTILTLIKRFYVIRDKRQIKPTELGELINDLLVANFSKLINLSFTATMESNLDLIEEGSMEWIDMLKDFYAPFMETVEDAIKNIEEMRSYFDEETDFECEKCGRKMVKKIGRFGYFLACPGFPACSNAKPIPIGKCPKKDCDGFVVKRSTKRGRPFYGCNNYPDCDFSTWDTPQKDSSCPLCGSIMFEQKGKKKNNPKAENLACLQPTCSNNHTEKETE